MHHDLLSLALMFAAGMVLGGLYFSGLWFTVQRIQQQHHAKHPAFWIIASLVFRMTLLLIAFYVVLSYGSWAHLLAVLAGFIVLRMISTRKMRQLIRAEASVQE